MSQKGISPVVLGVGALVVIAAAVALAIGTRKPDDSLMPAAPSSAASSPVANAVAATSVLLQNYAFSPSAITVKVGVPVTWTNKDSVHHTVTIDSGSGLDSPLLATDQSYSYTFTKAGTYTYHCAPHPYMHGTVVVTE